MGSDSATSKGFNRTEDRIVRIEESVVSLRERVEELEAIVVAQREGLRKLRGLGEAVEDSATECLEILASRIAALERKGR